MEKSLDKILAKEDFKRMSDLLKEKTEYIAKQIRLKMSYLEVMQDEEFDDGEIGYNDVVIKSMMAKSNAGFYREYLAIKRTDNENECIVWASLEDINHTYWFCGDFNAKIVGATSKEALAFLNVASDLIRELGKIEEDKAKQIEQSLKDCQL